MKEKELDAKSAVDRVIDAIINLTADGEIDENARMFLSFLKEEKYKGVYGFDNYLQKLAVGFAMAADNGDWRQKFYSNEFWQKYAKEFTNWITTKK